MFIKRIYNKIFISLLIYSLLVSPCFAAMKLCISDDCQSCETVMRLGKQAIEELKDKGDLELIDVSNVKTDLPALPALVDGEKVIIGAGLLEYLAEKAGVAIPTDD